MREVRSFPTIAEAYLVAGLLEAEGIRCEVREAALAATGWIGRGKPFRPSVWIIRDEDAGAAAKLLDEPLESAGVAWSCATCHSENEPQFDACWSCGATRE
jgi:hypothetical protein